MRGWERAAALPILSAALPSQGGAQTEPGPSLPDARLRRL